MYSIYGNEKEVGMSMAHMPVLAKIDNLLYR